MLAKNGTYIFVSHRVRQLFGYGVFGVFKAEVRKMGRKWKKSGCKLGCIEGGSPKSHSFLPCLVSTERYILPLAIVCSFLLLNFREQKI